MRTLIATLAALMLFVTIPAGAGDYQKAFQLLEPLAEQGDARARDMLGSLYAGGKGVPEDDAKAVHWFTKCEDVVEQQQGSNRADELRAKADQYTKITLEEVSGALRTARVRLCLKSVCG